MLSVRVEQVPAGEIVSKPRITDDFTTRRPVGPPGTRPGRKAGMKLVHETNAEGEALLNPENKILIICQLWLCAAPLVLIFVIHISRPYGRAYCLAALRASDFIF